MKEIALDRADVSWAAGLFEGEGSIGIYRSGGTTPILRLQMTDQDVIRRFHQKVGLGRVNGPYDRHNGTKPQWAWNVTSFEKVQALIAQWWPWLGSRRRAKAAEILLKLRNAPIKSAHRMRCPRGHPYSAENTMIIRRRSNIGHRAGQQIRVCRACSRINQANARRARPFDLRQLQLDQPTPATPA